MARLLLLPLLVVALASVLPPGEVAAAPRQDTGADVTGGDGTSGSTRNDWPIIGILSQELPKSLRRAYGNRTSYIAASYVKHIESAGARVVPIRINMPDRYYRDLFNHLNGLVFPGGAVKLDDSGYGRAARQLWDTAAKHSDDFFPIWGTCLGFELLTFLELNERRLARCSSQNQALPLDFEPNGMESRMFSGASRRLLRIFVQQNVTINFHKYCVSPQTYASTSLARDYNVIATNRDWKGQQFISAFEHKTRPVYGVQFHPEKNAFEWGHYKFINAIPHTPEAIETAQYLANFFVSEVRKNNHKFPSVEEEMDHLIYNYQPVDTSRLGSSFVQVYLFD